MIEWPFILILLYVGGISVGLIAVWYFIGRFDAIIIKRQRKT